MKTLTTLNTALDFTKNWWQQRQPRERWLLLGCAVVVFLFGMYRLLALHISNLDELQKSIDQNHLDLVWLQEKQQQFADIQTLGGRQLTLTELASLVKQVFTENELYQTNITTHENTIRVVWQGKKPSQFMDALSQLHIAGARITDFAFQRTSSSSDISVTIVN